MAYADYRHCDVCDAKAFYDSNLQYDFDEHPGTGLFNVGDWAVICRDCAKTYRTAVLPRLDAAEVAVLLDAMRAGGVPEELVAKYAAALNPETRWGGSNG